ncbi:MAG: hypothetical protein N2255_04690, partial [Kiritimatiellae bacterium]|nr:hypothetical protein [Kiritimatiellia bacterium]
MKKALYRVVPLLVGCFFVAAGLFTLTSCEEAENLKSLTVTPSFVVLPTGSNVVEFTVGTNGLGPLSFPLEWSVSRPDLGRIVRSAGAMAVYQRNPAFGENTVVVRDQYHNEGYATVRQIAAQYALVVKATPNPIPGDANTSTVTVEGGELPYSWRLANDAYGRIQSTSGNAAVYRSRKEGVNVVIVTDANGAGGLVAITQLPAGTVPPPSQQYNLSISADPNPIPTGNNNSIL